MHCFSTAARLRDRNLLTTHCIQSAHLGLAVFWNTDLFLQTMVSGYLKRAIKLCQRWYKHGKDFIIYFFFFTRSFLGHIWCQQLGEWGCFASTSSQHRSRWIWLLWLRFHLWLLGKKSTSCTRLECCYVESAPHHFVFEENFKCKINIIYSLLVCMFSLN